MKEKATSDKGTGQNSPLQTTSPDHKWKTTTVALWRSINNSQIFGSSPKCKKPKFMLERFACRKAYRIETLCLSFLHGYCLWLYRVAVMCHTFEGILSPLVILPDSHKHEINYEKQVNSLVILGVTLSCIINRRTTNSFNRSEYHTSFKNVMRKDVWNCRRE